MNKYRRRRITFVMGLLLILSLFFVIPRLPQDEKVTAASIDSEVTVDLDDYTDKYSHISMEFLWNSMPQMAKERTEQSGFSDAVSFPFVSSDKEAIYQELQEEILRNPVEADMVARGLKDIKLSSGSTIGELNPWLNDFISATDEGMQRKTHPRGNEIWLEQKGSKVMVTKEYRKYAAMICVLLDRLQNNGVVEKPSSLNYCLPLIAEGSLTRTELANYQENKPALELKFVRKDGVEEFVIGFNIYDKRFEMFDEQPTPTKPEPGTPGKPGKPGEPGKPGKPGEPGKPDKPGDSRKKDPSKAPVNQGNAQVGGGDNRPTDGPGKHQKTDPTNDKTQGHQNPSTVKPSAPSTNKPVNKTDENKMDYGLDKPHKTEYGNGTSYGGSGGNSLADKTITEPD